jgi:dCTP diphosphatase
MKKIIERLIEFREKRGWGGDHTPENLSKSVCIEAAEILECFQWDENLKPGTDIKKECGDVLIYMAYLCHRLGFKFDEVMQYAMERNAVKYPVK